MPARQIVLRLGVALGVSLLTGGCTEQDAEELSEALEPLIWMFLAILVVFAALLAWGLWLLVSGMSRARQEGAGAEEVRAGRRRAVVGGVMVAVVVGAYMGRPAVLATALAAAVGFGVHSWRTGVRGLPVDEVVARAPKPLAVVVAGLFAAGVLTLASGQPSVVVKTTEQPVLPSPSGSDVRAEPDCRRREASARCDEVAELSRRLVLSPAMFARWAGPVLVSVEPDGSVVALSSVTSPTGGLEVTAGNYVEAFEEAGWQWTNRLPCPPDRRPTFCESPFFLFSGATAASLHFERRSAPVARAELDLSSQGNQEVIVQARITVTLS